MTNRWLIALIIAGLSGGKAFADCVPSADTPASVIEYFQKFNKPLPEQFCAKEDATPQASEEPSQEPPQAYEDSPDRPRLSAGATMLSYPPTTCLFQGRPILLPMAYGLVTLNLLVLDLSGSISGANGQPALRVTCFGIYDFKFSQRDDVVRRESAPFRGSCLPAVASWATCQPLTPMVYFDQGLITLFAAIGRRFP